MVQAHNSSGPSIVQVGLAPTALLTRLSDSGRGRGAYFKARFAGRKGQTGDNQTQSPFTQNQPNGSVATWSHLSQTLDAIDGQQYGRFSGSTWHNLIINLSLSRRV